MQATEMECPLCMEPLEIDDVNFYPCACGYQVCRFCWHRIRTDENGLCPACRRAYSEDPAVYTPLSQDEIQKILRERKQKDTQRKQKLTENRKHLASVRVVQKNLVFVVGLTQRMAEPELLKRPEYFSKFGKIIKIVVNNNTNYAGPQGPSASAYITYAREEDAVKAILAVSHTQLDGRTLKTSLGTTKYCSYFLRNIPCPKTDCMYLHELGDGAASFTKEDMQAGKHQEFEQQFISLWSKKLGLSDGRDSTEQWPSPNDTSSSALPTAAAWAEKNENPQNSLESPSSFHGGDNVQSVTADSPEEWDVPDTPSPVALPTTTTAATTTTTERSQNHNTIQQAPTQTHNVPQRYDNTGWRSETIAAVPTLVHAGVLDDPGLFGGSLQPSGLGLTNLHLKVGGEDDLGFDPWNESRQGLANLLEEEIGPNSNFPQSQFGVNTRPHPGFPLIQDADTGNMQNWQDGLRALLPNINISFSDSVYNAAHQSSWPPSHLNHDIDSSVGATSWNPGPTVQPMASRQAVRPPPGFEVKKADSPKQLVDDPSILWSKSVHAKVGLPPAVIPPNGFTDNTRATNAPNLPGATVDQPAKMVGKSQKHPESTHTTENSANEDNRRRMGDSTAQGKTTQQRPGTETNYHTNVTTRLKDRREAVGAGRFKQIKPRAGGLSDIPLDDPPFHLQKEHSGVSEKMAHRTTRQQEKRNTAGELSRKRSEEGGRDLGKAGNSKRDSDVKPREGTRAQKAKQLQGKGKSFENDGVVAGSSPKASSAGKKQSTGHLSKPSSGRQAAVSAVQNSNGQNSTRGRHIDGESKPTKKPQKVAQRKAEEAQGNVEPHRSVISQNCTTDLDGLHDVAEDLKKLQILFKDMFETKDGHGQISSEMQSALDKICSHATDTVANQILPSMPGSDVAEPDVANLDGLTQQVEHARLEAASAEKKLMNLLEKNTKHKKTTKKK